MKFNLISVNLKKYSTIEDFKQLGIDNDINFDCEYLISIKKLYSKIFIEKSTCEIIAVEMKDGTFNLTNDFTKSLKSIKPISIQNKEVDVDKLDLSTIDEILDKINESGINSLTIKEKFILDKQKG